MSMTLGAFEAKTRLSELLVRVEAGEQVTITKHGRPVARLVPATDDAWSRDWPAFWGRVDSRLISMPKGSSIKGAIEAGRR